MRDPQLRYREKARAWLEEKGVEYRFHDYKVSGMERDRLDRWWSELGWEKLVNRAGVTFRKLADPQKNLANAEQAMAVMLAHPSVFKPELYQSLKW